MIARLNEGFEDARVTGYEDLIPVMRNHPKDRHVLAAAVTENVDMIVTNNTKDFPREACDRYEIEVMSADEFLLCQWSLGSPSALCTLLEELVDSYSRPAFTLSSAAAEPWSKVAPKFSLRFKHKSFAMGFMSITKLPLSLSS
jgi:hypothetical protein